ncbi:MAG: hypothetical protein ACK4UJ_08750 [Leptonema sp. (in: bacteria)]
MLYKKTVQLILESIGRPEEVEYYLKRFKTTAYYFAVIVPDYQTLEENFEHFFISLDILARLELFAIILITGPNAENYQKKFSEKEIFETIIVSDLEESTKTIEGFLNKNNKKILTIFSNSFLIDFINKFNKFLPTRIHFVRNKGFIRDKNHHHFYMLNALGFKDKFSKKIELSNPEALDIVLEEDVGIYILSSYLYQFYESFHISITSPFMLLKELFTIKGSGTLIRKPSKILHYTKEEVSDELFFKIRTIIEECFQKKVKDQALENFTEVFLDSEQKSLILLEKKEFGYYLSKFAVSIETRGKGIAQDLWDELQKYNYPLFWKTNQKNSIKKWYEKISDGFFKLNPYFVYWKNISYRDIPKIIDYIQERGSDFYE